MTFAVDPPAPWVGARRAPEASGSGGGRSTAALVSAALALFVVAGAVLVFRLNVFAADTVARVANASAVVGSRTPRLEAIGFVWGPIPGVLIAPLLLLRDWFPDLLRLGYAANLVSAGFMAVAVGQLHAILRDWGVGRIVRITIVVAFALHPIVLFYGSNGMSEAPFVCFLLVATRALSRWIERDEPTALMTCGAALGLAYLTRYEAAAAAAATGAVVWLASYVRGGSRRSRGTVALADLALLEAPVAFAFLGFAFASWVVIGEPFAQFTSIYGASTLKSVQDQLGVETELTAARVGTMGRQILALAPILPLAIVAVLGRGLRRHDPRVLAPLTVLGGSLAGTILVYVAGNPFNLLRYYITAVPLALLCIGLWLAPPRGRVWWRCMRFVGVAALLFAAFVSTALAMAHPDLGRQEFHLTHALVGGEPVHPNQELMLERLQVEREAAAYLDSLRLPDGSVLIDVVYTFPVILESSRLRQFVIPADQDFRQRLEDPVGTELRYLVVSDPGALRDLDAIDREYPDLYARGRPWLRLVREWDNRSDFPDIRLYQVVEPPGAPVTAALPATSPWAAYWARSQDSRVLQVAARDFAERLVEALSPRPTDVVLDFGCGFGNVALALAPHVGEVHLWDAAPQALAAASARAAALAVGNVRIVDLGPGGGEPPPTSYDLIVVNSVVQYLTLEEVAHWLGRWRRLLAPGGIVLLSDVPTSPPGLGHETMEWLRFCRRHRMLLAGSLHTLREAARYGVARQAHPLLCLAPADLDHLAADAGLRARPLAGNLTCRSRRRSVVLGARERSS